MRRGRSCCACQIEALKGILADETERVSVRSGYLTSDKLPTQRYENLSKANGDEIIKAMPEKLDGCI